MKKKSILVLFIFLMGSFASLAFTQWKKVTIKKEDKADQTYSGIADIFPSCLKMKEQDIFFKVDVRFATSITKEELLKARSIRDIYPEKVTAAIADFSDVKIALLPESDMTTVFGYGEKLNDDQLKVLHSANYSTDFYITSHYGTNANEANKTEGDHIVYYMTVVPEKQAEYADGTEALNDYIKEGIKYYDFYLDKNKLTPGKIRFRVEQDGTISNIEMESSCAYPSVDATMKKLISDMKGSWHPAENSKGEKIVQELVLFYGIEGC